MLLVALVVAAIAPAPGDAPYRQPSVAVGNGVTAVAFGGPGGVYFASTKDNKPVLVSTQGKLALGRHRGPKLVFAGSTAVITAIIGEKGGGADGDLFAWRSADGGRTWTEPVRVNDVPAAAREGLHGVAASGSTVAAVWLDLRAGKGMKLYGSISRDSGATWSENTLVYESPAGTICTCCHPSVAIAEDGTVTVMFRNVLDGNRDMYLTRWNGTAEKVGEGSWKIDACPMDGGSLAFDPTGRAVTVWRRESQVYLAHPGSREELLGPGKDPAMALGRKGAYVVWTQGQELKLRRPGQHPETLDPTGAWASLASLPDGRVVAAWESGGAIRVTTLPE